VEIVEGVVMGERSGGEQPEEDAPPADAGSDVPSSEQLALVAGEPVRWRRQPGARWHQGTVIGREADGSVGVRDGNGAWRSIPVERLEAQIVTKRGAKRWRPATEVGAERTARAAADAEAALAAEKAAAVEEAARKPQLKLW
jgi:hypothetical protein